MHDVRFRVGGRTGRVLAGGSCAARGTGKLDVADNHGINAVEGDGKQHPEDGGEEEAADDLAYGMVLEEAIGAVLGETRCG